MNKGPPPFKWQAGLSLYTRMRYQDPRSDYIYSQQEVLRGVAEKIPAQHLVHFIRSVDKQQVHQYGFIHDQTKR